ncbi:MAG: hypothetical protein IT292_03105 [Deltaproteobacteria bacterium]|nr:hypothetical protein [Deltaproteobacteria bacterium]
MPEVIIVLALIVSLFPQIAGAEPYSDLYPNQQLKKAGSEKASSDVQKCLQAGRDYTANQLGGGRNVIEGAAKGAAVGDLGAAIMKEKAGRGAGAAVGGLRAAGVGGNVAGNHKLYG